MRREVIAAWTLFIGLILKLKIISKWQQFMNKVYVENQNNKVLIQAIDQSFYEFTGTINHAGC